MDSHLKVAEIVRIARRVVVSLPLSGVKPAVGYVGNSQTVREGRGIAERVKESLMAQGREIVDVVVHVEPLEQAGRRCKDGEE